MTEVYYDAKLLMRSDLAIPRFKWIKVARQTGLKLENYGSIIYFYGKNDKTDDIM
ncbi:MAG: U-exon [Agile wallaby adenovirus 1]|nr:MAG: U-exon [Agile wallaby atadenovirus 1]